MKCLRRAKRTITAKVLARTALLVVSAGAVVLCAAASSLTSMRHRLPLSPWEPYLGRLPVHISEFVPVSEPLALPACGDVRPPEALLTPDPMLQLQDDDRQVRVSFIVGSDGHVHSAFILDSGGPDEDQRILRAVLHWRYRPALCNGVPTDSEARVRFALR